MTKREDLQRELEQLQERGKEIERLMASAAREDVDAELTYLLDAVDKLNAETLGDLAGRLTEITRWLKGGTPKQARLKEHGGDVEAGRAHRPPSPEPPAVPAPAGIAEVADQARQEQEEQEETQRLADAVREAPAPPQLDDRGLALVLGEHAQIPEIMNLAREAEKVGRRNPTDGRKEWPASRGRNRGATGPPFELIRERAQRLGTFTAIELQASLGLVPTSGESSRALMAELQERGTIRAKGEGRSRVNQKRTSYKGRLSTVYEFVRGAGAPAGPGNPNRPKESPRGAPPGSDKVSSPKRAALYPNAQRGKEIAGTGRQLRAADAATQKLLDDARRAGAEVAKTGSGHFSITTPSGRASISATPSDPRTVDNERAQLRRMGLSV